MSTIESVQHLYAAFERVFPRPVSFHNEGCCVKDYHERPLLELPLRELTEEMLQMPIDHNGACFGTFEELSYFVPRMVELLADSENGFEYGVLSFSFFRMLRDNEQQYKALGVWSAIEGAICDILALRTQEFHVRHYDRGACEKKGWGIEYFDLMVWTDLMDDLLGELFFPILSRRPLSPGCAGSEWDTFIARWAEDSNPCRVAHLLDIVRRYWADELYDGYTLPNSFVILLRQREFQSALVKRAEPAFAAVESTTWLEDVLGSLEGLVSTGTGGCCNA